MSRYEPGTIIEPAPKSPRTLAIEGALRCTQLAEEHALGARPGVTKSLLECAQFYLALVNSLAHVSSFGDRYPPPTRPHPESTGQKEATT